MMMAENTVESGLTVSVESSPRTPPPPTSWVSESYFTAGYGARAPLKKRIRIHPDNQIIDGDREGTDGTEEEQEEQEEQEEESISPRVLWAPSQSVARQLDFSAEELLSPIIAAEVTTYSSIIASVEDTIGDCGVCYLSLPTKSNHVFTACGHLFCVKCFLTWWDIAINCPLCRANLFVVDDNTNIFDNDSRERISE